jgi:hypothetical protein
LLVVRVLAFVDAFRDPVLRLLAAFELPDFVCEEVRFVVAILP